MPATSSQAATPSAPAVGPQPNQHADGEQAERVPEVVLDRGLVDRDHVGRDPRPQRVRAECAGADGDEQQQRSKAQGEAGGTDMGAQFDPH